MSPEPAVPAGDHHHHGGICGGRDHHSGEYTPQQQADLDLVLAFNASMSQAINEGLDVTATEAFLDPDPLRYMWVDEGQGRIAEQLAGAEVVLAQAPRLAGDPRDGVEWIDGSAKAARPSIAATADGTTVTTWIEWVPQRGDVLRAQLRHPADIGEPAEIEEITTDPVDLFRPVAAVDAAGTFWVFVARRDSASSPVGVYATRRRDGEWTPLEQVSDTAHPSFNHEVAADAHGGLTLAWQAPVGSGFGIYARTRTTGGWGRTSLVSEGVEANVWDPAVVALPGGSTLFAWSEYAGGSYRVVLRTRSADGELGVPRVITEGSDYALHPSLAVTADERVWCAFDVITMHGHAGSGPTRLRPAHEVGVDPGRVVGVRPSGNSVPSELIPEVSARVRVLEVLADHVREAPGEVAARLDVVPSGLPKLVAGVDGGLAVVYRVHRKLPLMTYYWEVAAQALGPQGWEAPTTFSGTDGTLEEPSVAAYPGGFTITAQMDRRLERALTWSEGFGGRDCPYLYEHHGSVIWHGIHGLGQIVRAHRGPFPPLWTPGDDAAEVVRAESDLRAEARRWVSPGDVSVDAPDPTVRDRPSAVVAGERMQLYWGDLHRHSLVSRCTSGDEPSLEDFYRYAWDVCDYDFWAVTDHAENSSDHQWWSIQKIADLFHIPGRFVPLYGFEWTSPSSGHQNVIYGDVERGAPLFSCFAEETNTPAGLWEALEQHPAFPAITIPHHPGAAMVNNDWDFNDPTYSRLVEIFQACRGNYETPGCFRQYADGTATGTFALDGLLRGYRFGFVASSDHGHGASYVGAYARSLDRAEVFGALQARRTFAATTRDVRLDVRLVGSEGGEAFMGQEAVILGGRTVRIHATGYADLARIEIVRDGQVVHVVSPQVAEAEEIAVGLRVEWGEADGSTVWDGTLRMDGGRVLATPFWGPQVVAVSESSVAWRATTHSFGEPYGAQRGEVELTLVGPPSAEVLVEMQDRSLRTTLTAITEAFSRDGRIGIPAGVGALGRAGLQPSVGGLTSLGVRELSVEWTDPTPGLGSVSFYYVRSYLTDGEMAWSSPIWALTH
ncbi:MAG: DUF3604 domain-containing protein [Ornithinimicrobium sp.]